MPDIATILVHVDESRHSPARIKFAAAVAQRCNAALAGFAAVSEGQAPAPVASDDIETWSALQAKHRQFVLGRVEEHFSYLRRQMPGADCRIEELPLPAKIAAAIAREGRRADLVVLGQNTADLARPDGSGMMTQDVMMAVGRPTLIVPHAGQFTGISQRPLIAWNETREAARAVQDSLPLLRYADTAYLLEVGDPQATPADAARRRVALADMARYLEAHALLVAVEYLPAAPGADIGRAIMDRAAAQRADLLVMGGYGHSRLQEIALGGVTRHVLATMDLPVLMAH